jgi:hypothetical protein
VTVRRCIGCGTEKPDDAFYRRGSGRIARCKTCVAGYGKTDAARARHGAYLRTTIGRYNTAKQVARKRGIEFSLSLEEFERLRSQPCAYCDGPLPETGGGLDRKENQIGYTTANACPCCVECNRIKSDRYTADQMTVIGALLKGWRL